ncbi:MAG: hypothetical protein M1480_18680 [Bacteroidetes bacterium]|nr:hypothetical protein [Bacteroidota bacterium]
MARVNGSVIGNLSGRLGNLTARTVNGTTILAARPSSYTPSQAPVVLDIRQKFVVTANLSKQIASFPDINDIWKKSVAGSLSGYNAIFQANNKYVDVDKPTDNNIITPEGFGLNITSVSMEANAVDIELAALNAIANFSVDETQLSAFSVVCFINPINVSDAPYKIIALTKQVNGYDFAAPQSISLVLDPAQTNTAAKYQHNIIFVAVATKTADGKLVQYSSTYAKSN